MSSRTGCRSPVVAGRPASVSEPEEATNADGGPPSPTAPIALEVETSLPDRAAPVPSPARPPPAAAPMDRDRGGVEPAGHRLERRARRHVGVPDLARRDREQRRRRRARDHRACACSRSHGPASATSSGCSRTGRRSRRSRRSGRGSTARSSRSPRRGWPATAAATCWPGSAPTSTRSRRSRRASSCRRSLPSGSWSFGCIALAVFEPALGVVLLAGLLVAGVAVPLAIRGAAGRRWRRRDRATGGADRHDRRPRRGPRRHRRPRPRPAPSRRGSWRRARSSTDSGCAARCCGRPATPRPRSLPASPASPCSRSVPRSSPRAGSTASTSRS